MESEGATLLPLPESFVLKFDFGEDGLTWAGFKDTFWLLLEYGPKLVPGLAFLVELFFLLLVLVCHFLLVDSHLGEEPSD